MIINWLKKKFSESESDQALDDINKFLSALKDKDDQEIAMLLAIATLIRLNLTQKGSLSRALLDDSKQSLEHRKSLIYLSGVVRAFQKGEQAFDAAGAMVWLCSLKSHLSPVVQRKTADLWEELKRGFPHVEEKFKELAVITGNETPNAALTEYRYIPARVSG